MLRKAFWDIRWSAFWFSIGGAGYTLLVSLFYPTFRQQSESITKLIATYPKGMLTALGYTDMTTFAGFIGAESLNLFWPIIIGVFATLSGASMVAKEVEDGTSEIWLSVPAARWRLLTAKMAALALGLLGAVAACVVIVEISAQLEGAAVTMSGLLAMGTVMAAFAFVVAAYSGLLSSLLSSRGAAAGVSFAITLGSYALWLIGGLSDQWKDLKNVSIFTAYTPQRALESGSADLIAISILVLIMLLCVTGALVCFERRDAI